MAEGRNMDDEDKRLLRETLQRLNERNGNSKVIDFSKSYFLVSGGNIITGVVSLVILIVGVTIPLYMKVGDYQRQNYVYQSLQLSYAARQDCRNIWELQNPGKIYGKECEYIQVPTLSLPQNGQ